MVIPGSKKPIYILCMHQQDEKGTSILHPADPVAHSPVDGETCSDDGTQKILQVSPPIKAGISVQPAEAQHNEISADICTDTSLKSTVTSRSRVRC